MDPKPLLLLLVVPLAACTAKPHPESISHEDGVAPEGSEVNDVGCPESLRIWPEVLAEDADAAVLLSPGTELRDVAVRGPEVSLPSSSWPFSGGIAHLVDLRRAHLRAGDPVSMYLEKPGAAPLRHTLYVTERGERPRWLRPPMAHQIDYPHSLPGIQLDLWLSPETSDRLLLEVRLRRIDSSGPERRTYVVAHRLRRGAAHGALIQATRCDGPPLIEPGGAYEARLVAIDERGHVAEAPAQLRFFISERGLLASSDGLAPRRVP